MRGGSGSIVRNLSWAMRSWNESSILVDKKSKFQARCCTLTDQKEVPSMLNELVRETKAVAKASHPHMYAWRTGDVKTVAGSSNGTSKKRSQSRNRNNNKSDGDDQETRVKNLQQGSSDCGEAGAGQRLLTLLERSHAINVLVIVTRWYGGTPLGPARFRHISTAAVESLKLGKYIS
ncbi:uncharacterized protein KNAG_0B02960 [Huiozyma naganishii CBS 8797]|uniref:Impact N-terminal domain-containing protein n=1 Tax=Huiozyma naganishii (strain ATCC MYA-139 / BCRC 22969 / CBS 8797 / KCTC 17520 / NBRC 10181 / NCYC 3082 / Yp74L-3) TaxID=1071383 RepID=J7RGS1_HUIN7|nr:hypothetical protein KNAG_0B02960 [Kazachstania naganishii CBS 8797]CCK68738.1 hypothetical protein KNAG_0B02960 [Kazachstania naganishii CBS 8797]